MYCQLFLNLILFQLKCDKSEKIILKNTPK